MGAFFLHSTRQNESIDLPKPKKTAAAKLKSKPTEAPNAEQQDVAVEILNVADNVEHQNQGRSLAGDLKKASVDSKNDVSSDKMDTANINKDKSD